jgi:hypothetical protein
MTLKEYVQELPEAHRARKEYDEMVQALQMAEECGYHARDEEIIALKEEIAIRIEDSHLVQNEFEKALDEIAALKDMVTHIRDEWGKAEHNALDMAGKALIAEETIEQLREKTNKRLQAKIEQKNAALRKAYLLCVNNYSGYEGDILIDIGNILEEAIRKRREGWDS